MKFNMNEEVGGQITIFNNGIAGKVENVTVSVEKRKADEPDTYPDYKVVINDGSGSIPLTAGFNRVEESEVRQDQNFQRLKSVAKAVVPEGFVYPEVNTYTEAIDTLMKVIKDHSEGKKVNVFTSYGYLAKPSKFLGLRYFNFIENPNEQYSRLKASPTDVLERPTQDEPKVEAAQTGTSSNDWLM